MAEEKKPSAETGSTGLNRWGGVVAEEFLAELQGQRGRRVYREMADNDAVVGATLFAIEMALREVPWFTRPKADDESSHKATQFVHECMHDMSHTWRDFVSEILCMLRDGFSYFEIVYKKRDGKISKHDDGMIGWRKFGSRSWESLADWKFDENGGITAFIQQAPPNYKTVEIPIEKSILFRTRKEKNNPEGRSILRSAYAAWYYKKNLQALEGISLERVYAGFPMITLPQGASPSDESKAKDIVRKIRVDEQMGVVLPQGWELKLLGPEGGRGLDAYNTAIIRYRQEIMLSMLATFIALGIEKTGSYALAREARDFFQIALQGWLDNICETMNEFAVPKLLQLNGWKGTETEIVTDKVGQVNLDVLSNYIMRLATVGAINLDEQLEKYLREVGDLPSRLEGQAEVGKADIGNWHPQIKKNPLTFKKLKETEGELERNMRNFFRQQKEWVKNHWEELLPKGKSDIRKQGEPEDWEGWEKEFAQETEKLMGEAMGIGAEAAQGQLKIPIDWSLYNPEAQKFLREHALELAKQINDTTKERLKAVLVTGLELGESRDQLALRVGEVMEDATVYRTKLIAHNEIMRAYNAGAVSLYKEGNIKKKKWEDGQPRACPICQGLHGTIVDMDDDFDAEEFGNVSEPPAHINCGCTITGVVG